jgi:uncharacterized protein (DUF433 family)
MSERRTVHRSFRLRAETSNRLERRAAEAGETYTALAERFIDEGLRRIDHPGIDFVDEPAGRRACVVGTGLGVWEVIMVVQANAGSIPQTAGYLDVPQVLVEAAVAYYADHPAEIDGWLERNRRAAERAMRRLPSISG